MRCGCPRAEWAGGAHRRLCRPASTGKRLVKRRSTHKYAPPPIKAVRAAARSLTVLQGFDLAALQCDARESTLAELRELLAVVRAQISAVEAGGGAAA